MSEISKEELKRYRSSPIYFSFPKTLPEVAQWVNKDLVLLLEHFESLLWHRFNPWLGTSICHKCGQKRKKKKKKKRPRLSSMSRSEITVNFNGSIFIH